MSVSKQALRCCAALGVFVLAFAVESCNSLEVPDSNTAVQAQKKVERKKPRLSEALLSSHGLEEIWYLGEIAAAGGTAGVHSSYLMADGLFVVTQPARKLGTKHLIRFRRNSGESIWYEDLPGTPEFAPYAYHYPPESGKDPELFYSHLDDVTCLDLDTGRMLWRKTLAIPISTPLAADEYSIFAGSDLKKCFAVPKNRTVESWTFVTGGRIESAPLIAGDKVVFGSHDGQIVGLLPQSGFDTLRSWHVQTGSRVRGDMTAYGPWVFAGSEDYKLYCLRLDGSVQWSYVAESPIVDAPVVYRVAPNRELVFVISDRDALSRSPRTLLAIPLPRAGASETAQPIWRVENIRKIVSMGKKSVYVLLESGGTGKRTLAALDLNTGEERFRMDLEGWNFVPTNLADNGRNAEERGRIYLLSQLGAIQVIGEKLE